MNQVESEIAKLALDVIPSLAANGLTILMSKMGKAFGSSKQEDRLKDHLNQNERVNTLLQKASAAVAQHSVIGESGQMDELRRFLVSPELDSMLQQIYSAKLIVPAIKNHLADVQKEFTLSLAAHLKATENDIKVLVSSLFEALLVTCDEALTAAVQSGNLEALDAKNSLRQNVLMDEVASIKRSLELFALKPKLDIQEIHAFEEQLRGVIAQRHGYITPPNLSNFRKFPIADLYVANNFEPFMEKQDGFYQGHPISRHEFVSTIERTVVLGDPGAGKSTFSQKICFDLATNKDSGVIPSRTLIPILVVLRDYGAEKKIRSWSILQFVEATVNSKYQITPPQGAIEYLLLNGRAMVIFDGLDELIDSSYRREVTDDVETFCTLYPATPVLVTSRQVGYDQAPLAPKRFNAYRIKAFTEEQQRDYVQKWFSTDEDLSNSEKRDIVESFLRESQIVDDLRSNPLILGLMCNIYRGENYIPRNRPSVYEKCALMLFDRWDRNRRIDVPYSFEEQLSPVMKHIAYWIFSDQKLHAGVTESQLILKATEYLHGRSEEDIDKARKTAREFIEFCRGRAWIFRDTGTTASGEPLYQFTHRTFLEYFTAAQLVRTHATPEELANELLPRINRKEWDIVAQLSFQLQNNNLEGAADRLFGVLLAQATKASDREWRALVGFSVRCLSFIVPRPKIVRDIAAAALALSVRTASGRLASIDKDIPAPFWDYSTPEMIGDLLAAASSNRPIIADVIISDLRARILKNELTEASAAFDIAQYLTNPLGRRTSALKHLSEEWSGISEEILTSTRESIRALSKGSGYVSRSACVAGIVSAAEIVQWHGLGELFKEIRSLTFATTLLPIVDLLLRGFSFHGGKAAGEQLAEIGVLLSARKTPWVRRRNLGKFNQLRFPKYHKMHTPELRDTTFGIFCCLAVLLESGEKRNSLFDVLKFIRRSKNLQIQSVKDMLLLRYTSPGSEALREVIRNHGFNEEQSAQIAFWAERQTHFIGFPKKN